LRGQALARGGSFGQTGENPIGKRLRLGHAIREQALNLAEQP